MEIYNDTIIMALATDIGLLTGACIWELTIDDVLSFLQ